MRIYSIIFLLFLFGCKKEDSTCLDDFKVLSIAVSPTAPDVGQPANIEIVISNGDTSKTSQSLCTGKHPYKASIYAEYSTDGVTFNQLISSDTSLFSLDTKPLAYGEMQTFNKSIRFNRPGYYRLKVIFDSRMINRNMTSGSKTLLFQQ